MFLRLFLVPALIVGGLVAGLILLPPAFSWIQRLVTGKNPSEARSASQFLQSLDDPTKEVRWQAASDLSQVLLRDDRLACDGAFALELATRLDRARRAAITAEEDFAPRVAGLSPDQAKAQRKKLEADRDYILYLGACLGNFMVPVGAPLLGELASQEKGMEPLGLNERRRQAVWALANLGENLKRFDRLAADQQSAAVDQLEGLGPRENGAWAKAAAEFVKRRRDGKASALGIDKVLIKCSHADDSALREMAAFAMNFWKGTATEDAAMEKALVRLSYDDGRGEAELAEQLDDKENPSPTRAVVKRPGFRVQANATVALARRGSPKVRLGLLEEMLDPQMLRSMLVVQDRKNGKEQADEELIANTLVNALKATTELHQLRPEMDLSTLRPLVDRLVGNDNQAIRAEALRAQLALGSQN
jgi:hypothetical protein